MNQANTTPTNESITSWYRGAAPKYQELSQNVTATITSLLKTKSVAFLTVTARVKSLESVLEKFTRKQYASLEDLTDLLGVRVILYLDSDVRQVCSVLEAAFHAHPDLGVDKSEELAVDQIGYRSVHYTCDLGDRRLALDELGQYRGMKFEVQIRTVLQHAWAEIEHDRSYKFPGDLPPLFRRRLNLLAGTLELVDREFSTLAKDLDQYAKQAAHEKRAPIPDSQELDAALISRVLDEPPYSTELADAKITPLASIVDELVRFGVTNVAELRALLSADFLRTYRKGTTVTKVGFLRKAMMFADVDKYFAQVWERNWGRISDSTRSMLVAKYGDEKVKEIENLFLDQSSEKPRS